MGNERSAPLANVQLSRAVAEARDRGIAVSLTAPPYRTLSPIHPPLRYVEPPLGSVIAVAAESLLASFDFSALVANAWPWVPPCVILPSAERLPLGTTPTFLAFASRIALAATRRTPPTVVQVLDAIAARRPPDSKDLTQWISARLGHRVAADALEEQFGYALGERTNLPRSPATYSRRFAGSVGLNARDWRAVAQLIRWKLRSEGASDHHARDGGGIEMTEITAVRRARRYLRMSWYSAREIAGWEWLLERALRVAAQRGPRGNGL